MRKVFFFFAALAAMTFAGCEPADNTPKQLATPEPAIVEGSLAVDGFAAEWPAVEGATAYLCALASEDGAPVSEATVTEPKVTFTGLDLGAAYTLTVTALAENEAQNSLPASLAVTTAAVVEYGGESYAVTKMADGNIWFAENLRFVPAGKTPSSNPADKSGVWYPAANAEKKADPALVATHGLLYDAATAFGVAEVTEENAASLEGCQGICPDGWHIPTEREQTGLVGANSNSALKDESAPYYDTVQGGAPIDALDEAGFNWTFVGVVNATSPTATGAYTITNSPAGVDPVVYGAMSYVWGSTFYQKNASNGNMQFYGFMSTWTAQYKRVTVAYANYLSGYSLRCVKNK